MTALIVAVIVFVCTLCGALLGIFLSDKLPRHHREAESKSAVQLVMGLIASVAALVLGLLISSTHSSFDAQQAEVRQLAIHLFELDRALARLAPRARKRVKLARDRAGGRKTHPGRPERRLLSCSSRCRYSA